jgi:hypothetical protein
MTAFVERRSTRRSPPPLAVAIALACPIVLLCLWRWEGKEHDALRALWPLLAITFTLMGALSVAGAVASVRRARVFDRRRRSAPR